MKVKSLALLGVSAVVFGLPAASMAATITFSTPQNLSGPSDVQSLGVIDKAYDFRAPATPPALPTTLSINGVTFSSFDSQSLDTKTVGGRYDGFGTASQPGDYGTLLTNAAYQDGQPSKIVLNGLTDGTTYQIEVFVNDAREPNCCTGGTRTAVYSGDTGGTDAALVYDELNGRTGQFVYGSFTAIGTSQTLNINLTGTNTNNGQINGLVVTHVPVPEPTSVCLIGLAGLGLLRRRQRGN